MNWIYFIVKWNIKKENKEQVPPSIQNRSSGKSTEKQMKTRGEQTRQNLEREKTQMDSTCFSDWLQGLHCARGVRRHER